METEDPPDFISCTCKSTIPFAFPTFATLPDLVFAFVGAEVGCAVGVRVSVGDVEGANVGHYKFESTTFQHSAEIGGPRLQMAPVPVSAIREAVAPVQSDASKKPPSSRRQKHPLLR